MGVLGSGHPENLMPLRLHYDELPRVHVNARGKIIDSVVVIVVVVVGQKIVKFRDLGT